MRMEDSFLAAAQDLKPQASQTLSFLCVYELFLYKVLVQMLLYLVLDTT